MIYDQIEEQLLLIKLDDRAMAHARALSMTQFVKGPFYQRELVRQIVLCYSSDGDKGYLHNTIELLLKLLDTSFNTL